MVLARVRARRVGEDTSGLWEGVNDLVPALV